MIAAKNHYCLSVLYSRHKTISPLNGTQMMVHLMLYNIQCSHHTIHTHLPMDIIHSMNQASSTRICYKDNFTVPYFCQYESIWMFYFYSFLQFLSLCHNSTVQLSVSSISQAFSLFLKSIFLSIDNFEEIELLK